MAESLNRRGVLGAALATPLAAAGLARAAPPASAVPPDIRKYDCVVARGDTKYSHLSPPSHPMSEQTQLFSAVATMYRRSFIVSGMDGEHVLIAPASWSAPLRVHHSELDLVAVHELPDEGRGPWPPGWEWAGSIPGGFNAMLLAPRDGRREAVVWRGDLLADPATFGMQIRKISLA